MGERLRIFKLLMYKNIIVRKRHWKTALFVEIAIPILLFMLGEAVRSLSGAGPIHITTNTTHPPETQDQMIVPRIDFQVLYTPVDKNTDAIMEKARKCMRLTTDQMFGVETEDDMLTTFATIQAKEIYMYCFGVVFEGVVNSTLPKFLKYKLRVSEKLPTELFEEQENGNKTWMTFKNFIGFEKTQTCLEESIIEVYASKVQARQALHNITMSIQQMPYPPYVKVDQASQTAGQAFSELARLAFLVVLCVEVTFPTNEKYIGINILMSVNGVKTHQNLLSWLTTGVIFSVIYLAPIVMLLKYYLPPSVIPYLSYGDSFVLWIVLTIHACHVMAFGMHITAYLWKPSHGIFAAFMFTVLMDVLNKFSTGTGLRRFLIYLGIFSPNFLLSRMFDEINAYETKLAGVQWSNLFSVGTINGPPECCIGVLVIFSLLGIVLHFMFTLYVYSVRPGKYGVAQNPFFCFQKGNKVFHDRATLTDIEYNAVNQKEFEKVPEGSLTPGIQIRELKKAYMTDWFRRTTVQALKGINVDFYKGQITALLGHNGAGKTTMMSILAGLTGSSEGIVVINGKNVQYELDAVRGNLGLCPQENMVFPDLNVYEQVLFFGMLKAKDKTREQLEEEVRILLAKVNLTDKMSFMAKQLSGGQKRRMCLAMAVIGDASVLILDEPTSGMDAESKREVWDIILKMRGEKTILISTHDMEEADILGDRVAIIHSGKMRCYGTSMFLKKLYGDGQVEVTISIEPSCDLHRVVTEIGLNTQLLSQDEGQAVLAIPLADNLPEALDKLETQKKKLGITGLSVSIITLEQVFLRVTREEGDETDTRDQAAKSFVKLRGIRYLQQTCFAYIVKKFAFTRKNPWNFIITMLLPCLSAILLVLDHGSASPVKDPATFSLDAYSNTKSLLWSEQPIFGNTYAKSARQFGGTSRYIGPDANVTEALLEVAMQDLSTYRNKYIVSGEISTKQYPNTVGASIEANGLYSGTAILSIPATINMLSNAIMKYVMEDDEYGLSLTVQELPESFASTKKSPMDAIGLTMSLIVFLAPAVALYVTQPLQENLSGVKQLQFMTGASVFSYWFSVYLFDIVQYIISVILLISMFVVADASFGTHYYYGTEIAIFFLILFMHGLAILPLVYIFSFWKKSMNASTNLLSITPLILIFIDFLLFQLKETIDSPIYDGFHWIQSRVFLLMPHLSLVWGHSHFFSIVVENGRCRSMPNKFILVACEVGDFCCNLDCWDGTCKKPLPYFADLPSIAGSDFTTLKGSLLWATASIFCFFAIIFLLEFDLFRLIWSKIFARPGNIVGDTSDRDELVKNEESIVSGEVLKWMAKKPSQPFDSENIFLVRGLSKRYGSLDVVKGISFRVKQGECFGLLGVNGAGKSTTFRMLTGVEIPNSGSMILKNYSLDANRTRYLSEMGYCPQQDAIIDTLNAYDHLYLFARLRGIPNNEVQAAVEKWIHKLNLIRCAAQPSGTYSGGNKRRLNIAMALIGNPSLVLMDEPTTGVDPAARRSLWNTLKTCQEGGQSIILTSHSMEECEALCNRLVIMVKGQLVCIGASQELKQRFGAGYNIHIKLNPGSDRMDIDNIKRRIETTLVCKLIDENAGFIGYHVTDRETTWTIMYTMMNELKNDYPCIEDFAVLSSTLEQLFIQFARAPGDDDQTNPVRNRRTWRFWQNRNRGSPV